MEINDIKKLLDEQTKTIESNIDRKIDAAVKRLSSESKKYTDMAMSALSTELKGHTETTVKLATEESKEHTERYLGAMSEDFQGKLKVVAENTTIISETREDMSVVKETTQRMEEKLDATFERAGELSVDMTTAQQNIHNHEKRITVLEKA